MRIIGLDTETHLIKAGCAAPQLVCVSVAEQGADGEIVGALYDRPSGLALFHRLISDPEIHLTIHNAFFDLCVFAAEDASLLPAIFAAIDAGRIRCTMIREMMLKNAMGRLKFHYNEETNEFSKQSFALSDLVRTYLGHDIERTKTGADAWRLRYNELDGVAIADYPEAASTYAIEDAAWHLKVFLAQEVYCEAKIPGGATAEISQVQAGWALYLAGAWGVRTDGEAVAKLKIEVTAEYEAHLAVAQRHGFIRRTGVRDTEKIMGAVVDWYASKHKTLRHTDGGKVSTDREQLTDVACPVCTFGFHGCSCDPRTDDGAHRGLWAVAEVVRLSKLLSTYVRALERGTTVPLNPRYNPIIETYRTSCSQGMKVDGVPVGCNLQNPPRKDGVRECFVPRAGWTFAFADYDTLEMRTLAQICIWEFGYSRIAEAIREGRDVHLAVAAEVLSMTYEDAEARYAAGDAAVADARQISKPCNYGMAGGMAATTFVKYAKGYGLPVSHALAKKLHTAFRATWTEMNEYFCYISALVEQGGIAEVIEFPRSGLMRGNVNYTAAANGFFQHLAAMGAKAAMYAVSRECYIDEASPLYGCRPWLFAHDEIGIEIPYTGKAASDAALRLQAVMIEQMSVWCPDVPIGATACMTRRWRKGAKAVFVDGIMVPSRPEGKKWVHDPADTRMPT